MPHPDYDSWTAFWAEHEQGIWAAAAAENDTVDDNVMALQKAMFFLGAYQTLRILNRAGLIDETMPPVASLMTELSTVHIEVWEDGA
jgi:hypothetical protein